ncbi:hypothetical protein [Paenibacillus pini]|uniref:Uncharacterized protein n=1 Tax=Paenibacillus pini JCM 16418 TaxID=1236976 RepID=W7YHF3_9BACL|nr:hypothetical protein [Paenibacillus pini]GAF07008.1 hypothetical protein JCM16418_995 [Paenibacillus pini JCM 16418]
MSEKNILAYFKSPEDAESVSKKLQSLRVVDMSIDRFSRFPDMEMYKETHFAGDVISISSMGTGSLDPVSASIMAGADSSVSGMSHGGQGGPTGRDILLTVVVEEESFEQALKLIVEADGMV